VLERVGPLVDNYGVDLPLADTSTDRPRTPAFEQYAPDSANDECIGPAGIKPHWRQLVERIGAVGPEDAARFRDLALRLIHDNGVTHNVYGDPQGLERPWTLDLIPMVVSPDEWATIDAGLHQRLRLLEALLADVYGPRRLIERGVLPPGIVFDNPSFLRACAGWPRPVSNWVSQYAADVARDRSGRLMVMGDRTAAPSGAGYALENRIVMSRVLPDIFAACNVHRLASFFASMRDGIASRARGDSPRVVLLSPGPYNETYFEHAYLARYLGYTLAEGGDLTVRGESVYLKTLGGLQQVDAIVRRVDDDFADPVELRSDSYLGVPGLLEAARAQRVVVANAIGSAFAQTPALLAYLSPLCRALLGEELLLPSVETWWCGDEPSLAHVLANLQHLVIKPAFVTKRSDPIFGARLSHLELAALSDKIRLTPERFVAQAQMTLSTAPAGWPDLIEARPVVMRCFAAAGPNGPVVMPGGLTRVSAAARFPVVSMQSGASSKDTWVVSDGPVNGMSLLQEMSGPIRLTRGGGDLPSRIADDLYWLGRYVERADAIARIARASLVRSADQSGVDQRHGVAALNAALLARSGNLPLDSTLDGSGPGSLPSVITRAGDVAGRVRDRLSTDAYRLIQSMEETCRELASSPRSMWIELLDLLVTQAAAFTGMSIDSMTRGQARRFVDLGRRIERSVSMVSLLRSTLVEHAEHEGPVIEAVLEVGDSALTYRRRYFTRMHAAAAVDVLLADEDNPRSVAFQLATIDQHLEALPYDRAHPSRRVDRQLASRAVSTIRLANIEVECAVGSESRRLRLDRLLAGLDADCHVISELIGQAYFAMAVTTRQLGLPAREGAGL
jgi:uncharacterized circularly permuted ATP-grasp superfamily protein/uncharacterized alpha-E superfamily protein